MRARLGSIDFLRGMAALSVCVGHAIVSTRWTEIGSPAFRALCEVVTRTGALGVPLFFVISGFCIHLSYARRQRESGRSNFQFASFWKRRLWRLYPTYFVVLCCSMGLIVITYMTTPSAPVLAAYPPPQPLWMAGDFLTHTFMLHGFFPRFDQAAGNPPFWTLAREEYLYLMYPLLLVMRRRLSVLATIAVVIVLGSTTQSAVNASGLPLAWASVITGSVLPLWIQWSLGAAAAEAYCGIITLPAAFRSIWAAAAWAVVAEMYLPLYLIGYGMAFFTLINYCVAREAAGRWSHRGLLGAIAAVGTMSYSLYLVHDPIQTILLSLSMHAGTFTTVATYTIRVAFLVAGSIAVARLLFVTFESRFLFGRSSQMAAVETASSAASITA